MISIMFLVIGLILLFVGMGLKNRGKKDIDLKGSDGREYFELIKSGAGLVKTAGMFLLFLALVFRIIGY